MITSMIRQGKTNGWLQAPPDLIRSWSAFNGVQCNATAFATIEGKGLAVVAESNLGPNAPMPLMTVPKELALSLENVHLLAKSDSHLRAVLDALGDFGNVLNTLDDMPPSIENS